MFEQEDLIKLANWKMPFGKYKDRILIDLPEEYLLWFINKGVPEGKLGELISIAFEIKSNGLTYLLKPLKNQSLQSN